MRSGKSQLLAIILAVVIAFGCGLGGGVAAMYMVNNGTISLGNNDTRTVQGSNSLQDLGNGRSEQNPALQNIGSSSSGSIITVSDSPTIAEAIAEKAMPSVVGISTMFTTNYSSGMGGYGFWGWGYGGNQSYQSTAVGTGVIVDENGYILTNSHVINDGDYDKVVVSLYDGSEVEGKVLWYRSTLDLAVVKIEANNLVAAELGDSDELKIGSYAAAIGNPLGLEFQRSMSQGIISGMDRSIAVSKDSSGTSTVTMDGLLQTDATINSGNSGGPLYNSKGEVIGINTAKASSGEGMGFAIPINVAKPIVEEIKRTGSFTDRYIGISGIALEDQSQYTSSQLMDYLGVSKGIYVQSVQKGSGAEAAGLKSMDVITKVDGVSVNSMNKINTLLLYHDIGDTVELTIIRDKQEMTIKVTLTGGNINM